MTDYYLGVVPQSVEWELRANVARFSSPMGGVTRTLERSGSRWACTFRWDVTFDRDAARLRAFIASQRGGANRFWFSDPAYTQRGSFSGAEVLTNQDSASAFSSWTAGSDAALSIADNSLRVVRIANASAGNAFAAHAVTTVQYAPYAYRALVAYVRGTVNCGVNSSSGLNGTTSDVGSTPAMRRLWGVANATSNTLYLDNIGALVSVAGEYFEVAFASSTRCALVDNGQNMLLRSDEFDNAAWTKTRSSATANSSTSPAGNATSDSIIEDATAGATHEVAQNVTVAAAANDYVFTVAVSSGGSRPWCQLVMSETTGGTAATAYFNLSTGAVGTNGVGANWSNIRTFSTSLGNGWWQFTIVARKTNAATTISNIIRLATADNTATYNGNGTSFILVWRGTFAQSSVPTRLVQTTSAATTGTAQTGSAVYLKGLPASTNGLLYAGDWLEFQTPTYSELKRLTGPLNSDASGLGYATFEPILRASPADNAAVVITKPMCRMLLDESTIKTQHTPAGFMAVSFTAVEDVAV